MIRYIFSDMDGTILDNQGRITDTTIRAVQESKLPLTLISARSAIEMDEVIEALQLSSLQVAFNGGLIYRKTHQGREILHQIPMDFDVATTVLRALRLEFPQLSISFYDLDYWFTDKVDSGIEWEQHITNLEYQLVNIDEKVAQGQFDLFKIMLIAFDEEEITRILNFLEQFEQEEINIQRSGGNYLEITHAKATKGFGMDYIMSHHQLSKDEVVAFGDGHNDISMLERVDHAIVMENAHEEIKEYATYITKSNTEDGVAFGIKEYVMKYKK